MTQAVEGIFPETTVRSEGTNIQVTACRIGETTGSESRTFQMECILCTIVLGVRFTSTDGTTGLRGQVCRIAGIQRVHDCVQSPAAYCNCITLSAFVHRQTHGHSMSLAYRGDIIGSVNSIRQISLQSRMIQIIWTS